MNRCIAQPATARHRAPAPPGFASRAPVWLLVCWFAAPLVSGCCKNKLPFLDEPSDPTASSASAVASSPAVTSAPTKVDPGPFISIPAGTLIAGSPCQAVPRITNEELEGVSVLMGAFTIDTYPYPNDPAKAPLTNVSRDEAHAMCTARGRRLCTELEWERACKGPSNTAYPYGGKFNQRRCPGSGALLKPAGTYDGCQSAFGVKAVFGAAWEWTASDWGRGGPGGMVSVRGGGAENPLVRTRCANGQSRSPSQRSADLGFRCCGGTPNSATVQLPVDTRPALATEGGVDPSLANRLLAALPRSMRNVPDTVVSIDRIWRWHPRANEEVIIGRYRGKPRARGKRAFYNPVIFHLCPGSTRVLGRLRGPVAVMANPTVGSNSRKISLDIRTDADRDFAHFHYHYGNVTTAQPAWVKKGTTLDLAPRITPKVRLRIPIKKK